MGVPQYYLIYGGGLGDVVWDFMRDPAAKRLRALKETTGARVRVYTQCHNDGVLDVFKYHPLIDEHIAEPWAPPSPELAQRFVQPIDGYNRYAAGLVPAEHWQQLPEERVTLYLSAQEAGKLSGLLSKRPVVVVQPYAGLSDRDGFNQTTMKRLVLELARLDDNVRILMVGKNHERGCKYQKEEVLFKHPNMMNLIDQIGIRLSYFLVASCDAFCGSHSNLIRTAWDWRKRNACVLPAPLMTDHIPLLDGKYTYGWQYPESRIFTFPFTHGAPKNFEALDTETMAAHLLGRL
jgi:hypothetical protein